MCAVWLLLPYVALPFRFGIASSAVALLLFIGVWKALDVLAGTHPKAVAGGTFRAFAVHFASPVEFRIEGEERDAIVSAAPQQWRTELTHAAQTYASLALTASVRSALSARAGAYSHGTSHGPGTLYGLGTLYAEVWTIYLFLKLFTSTFATVLAVGGFAPQTMFDAPLTRATSIADFWSRRWNLLIHGLFRRTVFRPLTKRGAPPWAAGALAFAISGAFHEYAFALQQPALRASLGRCFCFFLLQAPIVTAEARLRSRIGVPALFARCAPACTLVWTLVLVPFAPLFLHPLKASTVFEQIYLLVPRLAFE